jgi:hypothetical protein
MKKAIITSVLVAAIGFASERVVVSTMTVVPATFAQTEEIRPRRIVIEYPDDASLNPTVSAIYEKLTVRTFGTNNTPDIVGRETVRQVQLQWPQAIALVPALTNARVEFGVVFSNLFTPK